MVAPDEEHLDPMAVARRQIAAEAEAWTERLEVQNLDLPEMPGKLFELVHLRELWLCEGAGGEVRPIGVDGI